MGLPIPTYLDYCSRTAVSDEHERSASSAKNSVSGQPGYHQQAVELIIKKTFLSRIKKKSTKIKKWKSVPFFKEEEEKISIYAVCVILGRD